jgi:hypothetical protein
MKLFCYKTLKRHQTAKSFFNKTIKISAKMNQLLAHDLSLLANHLRDANQHSEQAFWLFGATSLNGG